jgi:O-methyltransferase
MGRLRRRLLRRLAPSIFDLVHDRSLDVYVRERTARQAFFFNAFKALRFNGIDGDYAEFGSWGGLTFALGHQESTRHGHPAKLWAFDSFQGFPASDDEGHPEWIEGRMAISLEQFHEVCAANGIPRDAYNVVPGFYEDTLARMAPGEQPANIALAYIDCDLYSSTKTVLEFLAPRLKHGMIVAFDDYFCWSRSQVSGERRALLEFRSKDDSWEWLPYMQFAWAGMSFVLEDRALQHRSPYQRFGTR